MHTVVARLCNLFLISLLTAGVVFGQGGTAQISGAVTDASGAVLPGVEVTATQTETGTVRNAVSNETGSFVLPNLAVGPYKLEATLPGFRTFVQTGIVLQVNGSVVINPALQVGQVTESIEVQANAVMVETKATGIGQVIDNAQILQLPLVGRQVTDLVVLAGAAVQTSVSAVNANSFPGIPSFTIAGGLTGGTSFTLDGSQHNEVRNSGGLPLPFPDALQEFKVETSAVPAQYGFHSGGAVNAVTKSGTNDLHGTAFWFVRNQVFNARGFFDARKDSLKRNQFGGTVGGPIRHNKMFFFAGFQGTTTRQNPSGSLANVPTPAMLQGDFTVVASSKCRSSALTLRAPFENNRIDPSLFSPAGVKIAKLLPTPLDDCGLVQFGVPIKRTDDQMVGKMDYNFSNAHSMFVRYLAVPFDQAAPHTITDNPLADTTVGVDNLFQSMTLGDTHTFGSSLVNAFRIGWNRQAIQRITSPYFGAAETGINMYQTYPKHTDLQVTGAFTLGGTQSHPNKYRETGIQFADDIGLVRGAHQFAFGATATGFQTNGNAFSFSAGQLVVDGGITGLGMADLLLGQLSTLTQGAPSYMYARTKYFGFYAQDSWKMSQRLNLSYGIRWEPYFPQQYQYDQMNYFDQDAFLRGEKTNQFINAPAGLFYPGDPQFPTENSSPIKKQWARFAPRIGFTWDPMGDAKTVIRAAYGIFFDQIGAQENIAVGQGPPWAGKLLISRPAGGLDDPYRGYPGGNPFPFVVNKNAPYPAGGVFNTMFSNTRPPYVNQWNFGIQREVARDLLLSASYIGNAVIHVYGGRELNPGVFIPGNSDSTGQCFTTVLGRTVSLKASPGTACSTSANLNNRRALSLIDPVEGAKISWLDAWDDGGTRSYNGVVLSAQKRFSSNYSFTANYTLSHCIGTTTNVTLNSTGGNGVYSDPSNRKYDRGNCSDSGADIRHLVNATSVIQMPRFADPWVERFAGNWRLSGILKMKSGSPFSVVSGTDRQLTGINQTTQRANQIAANVYGSKCNSDLRATTPTCFWLNRDAFAIPSLGTLGNMGPGTIVGPGSWTIDAGVSRIFKVREKQQVEFRAEATNVLNHTNFNNPSGNLNSSTFGRIQSAGDPRIMQFALKYVF